jgi:hypothetical protein
VGVLSNSAGIEENDIGFARANDLAEIISEQNSPHQLGIVFVHLAAVGFKKKRELAVS